MALQPALRTAVLGVVRDVEQATGKVVSVPPLGGVRSYNQQAQLYADRASNPYPVAMPGTSLHEYGAACDLNIAGGTDDDYASLAVAAISRGLRSLYPTDRVHVELSMTLAQASAAWQALDVQRGGIVAVGLLVCVLWYLNSN